MKKSIYTVIALWGLLLCGCSKNENIPNGAEEPKEVLVSLAFKGEILVEDTPMSLLSRAGESTDDLYGIQIYKDGEQYRCGLFDNISDLQTLLQTGSKYKFVCTLVKGGKNLLFENNGFGDPFLRFYFYGNGSHGNVCPISDSWQISEYLEHDPFTYFDNLAMGSALKSLGRRKGDKYSQVSRYYGELENYTPVEDGTATIELKHTVFGIKTIVQGIPDGSVSITIKNSEKTFFSKNDITADYQDDGTIYECGDIYGAWQYADNYTENVIVSVQWTRGVGVVQDLGSKEIQVKRNMMNVIRVSLSADDEDANIGITTDTDGDMSDVNVNIDLN